MYLKCFRKRVQNNLNFKFKQMNISKKSFLLYAFVFIGVLGKIIYLPWFPHSFRIYYFILPIIVLYFSFTKVSKNFLLPMILLIPLFTYLLASSLGGYNSYKIKMEAHENPLFRLGLLFFLCISTFFLSSFLSKKDIDYRLNIVKIYLNGFFITLIFGFIFFIGYERGVLSASFIQKFQVQVQTSFSMIRMSPGSYPNEYGNVSSFALSVITLFLFHRKELEKEKIIFIKKYDILFFSFFYLLTIIALFLTTTRSAYISYILSLTYIILIQKSLIDKIKTSLKFVFTALFIYTFTQKYIYDVKHIFLTGFYAFFNKESSVSTRFDAWENSFMMFKENYIFGIGFANAYGIHNTYLQLFFELGFLGLLILFVTLFFLKPDQTRPDQTKPD